MKNLMSCFLLVWMLRFNSHNGNKWLSCAFLLAYLQNSILLELRFCLALSYLLSMRLLLEFFVPKRHNLCPLKLVVHLWAVTIIVVVNGIKVVARVGHQAIATEKWRVAIKNQVELCAITAMSKDVPNAHADNFSTKINMLI